MGEDKISISDKGETKVVFNEDFDDVDLLSESEKAALAEDVDLDGPAAKPNDSDTHTREADRLKAEAEAKEAADKAAEEKAKADEDAKALADAEKAKETPATIDKDGEAGSDEKPKAEAEADVKIVPELAPPTVLTGLTDDELKAVEDGKAKAKKDFQEGVIDYDEYLDQRDAFNQQIWAHNMAVQMSSESVDTRWEWEQETFLTDQSNEWINNDDVVYSAFAATVNRIMSTDEGAVMPGPELLNKAREEVAKRFSPQGQQDRVDQEAEKEKQTALQNAKNKEAGKQPPETLGGKPAAEVDDGVSEFDWIDKLEGEAYEKAVQNLSEAQLKRYEASI